MDPIPKMNLIINMWAIANGWNGNEIALRQKGAVVGTFGSTYVDYTVPPPVNIVVEANSYL